MKFTLFIAIIGLGFVASCLAADRGSYIGDAIIHQSKTWCTVRPGASDDALRNYLDVTCFVVNCKDIKPGGSCFNPNTLQNHASYVLNLDFRKFGKCDQEFGLPSINDPSFGTCHYS